ncbi:MAG: hypothetical protein HC840_00255 [Leptolyngbyaceae cyanobacterium RM2_2_4]|nr:hypothetical protein [Leptolyngbyaceae cyanobacterium RM2_2_4]
MGIFQLDLTVKTAIELGIEDMRRNPWLIDHMLGDCLDNPYLKDKYGQKQIDACKEWFLNNQIDIYMRGRNDKDRMPMIAITPGPAPEKIDMKHMADQSTETLVLMPQQIGKPIPYIVKPFTPLGYDMSTGIVQVDDDVKGMSGVAAGMILVDPAQGQGFVIQDYDDQGIHIEPGIQLDASQLAVVPQYQFYKARVEHTFFQESCDISCYAHGDPQVALWLHSIALYSILRYRESLLEAQGFSESSVSNSPLMEDQYYQGADGEQAFVRSIQLSGQTEYSWIKSPRRVLETAFLREKTGAGSPAPGYIGGIKILSNHETPDFIDKTAETWYTVQDTNGSEDDDE